MKLAELMKPVLDEPLIDRIRKLVRPILSSLDIELVDIEQKPQGRRTLFRLYIDKPEGVTIDDCQSVNVYLGRALDVEDTISFPYTLEVSSPGLDRPLKKNQDYQRSIGKLVRVKLNEPMAGEWVLIGRITTVNPESVSLQLSTQGNCELDFGNIREARLEVEWETPQT